MSEADARHASTSRSVADERVAIADLVIDNGGDLASLDAGVADLWARLQELPAAGPAAGFLNDATVFMAQHFC